MEKKKAGFIGLGKMGDPIAANLLKAGFPLTVYDILPEKIEKLAKLGGMAARSPKEVAENAEVTISMVLDDRVLEAVSVGPSGAFHGAKAGTIFVSMSTVSPAISTRLAVEAEKRKIGFLRAPVVGSVPHATAGTLTILTSGPEEVHEGASDILSVLGQKIIYLGKGNEALYQKLLINMMFAITAAMTAESLTFGERGGLDWHQMIEIVSNSLVGSPVLGYKKQLLRDRNYSPAFTVSQLAKDLDIALDAGRNLNIPMPVTSLVRQFFGAMQAQGRGEFDYFGLVGWMEELAGIVR
jgi:3-hydroxyisobutyrate dehydrogenase-like beta-hydroxyacid dehydrogenase